MKRVGLYMARDVRKPFSPKSHETPCGGCGARAFVSGGAPEDPEGFFFFTDKCVLVEQYHFGKLKQEDISAQKPGGEVPVFEFEDTETAKQYKLYRDHFDYLFRISKEQQ